jgi:glycosyltransferase involved in cell wall biosynthesis
LQFTAEEEKTLASTTSVFEHGADYRKVIVPNGVVIPEGMQLLDGAAPDIRNRFHELRGKDVVLFLSRINFKKGMDILARAFGIVARAHPNAHLVIAGPDNEGYGKKVRKWLDEEGVLPRTTFTGMLSGADKVAAFRSASVFVLPSYTENFGIAIVEAMSVGVPVVISNKVNIWREIEAAGAGTIVRCDHVETADAILRLLGDSELRNEMGKRGAQLVRRQFTWERVAEQMLALYEDLIGKRRVARTGG